MAERLSLGTDSARNDEDWQRKLNGAENLRPARPGDPDFATLYKRRNDGESINRNLDDTLWLRRAYSVAARRQLLNLITGVCRMPQQPWSGVVASLRAPRLASGKAGLVSMTWDFFQVSRRPGASRILEATPIVRTATVSSTSSSMSE